METKTREKSGGTAIVRDDDYIRGLAPIGMTDWLNNRRDCLLNGIYDFIALKNHNFGMGSCGDRDNMPGNEYAERKAIDKFELFFILIKLSQGQSPMLRRHLGLKPVA